ncbi:MAG: hypothetical protein E6Q83_16710 [Thiothrix sp.]|nr:MAG: hypothetical protein E6Q83_16710 [Thiothrix sp.]
MSMIELQAEFADELFQNLNNAGLSVSTHKEERYFGDSASILMILDIANNTIGIAASIIAIWAIKHNATIKINDVEHKPTTQEVDKEEIKKKLDQEK